MRHVIAIPRIVRAGLGALKASWLWWNESRAVAAGNIFQRRIDPLSGRPKYSSPGPAGTLG
jgi:hypothetical protein